MDSQNSQRSAPLNSNSESHRLAQGAEFVTNGNGHEIREQMKQQREEDESPLSIFARSVTNAKEELLQSLRKKLSSVKEESRIDVITANRKVHEVEIENSKLSQEISKEKEENKRSALSFQLAQDFIVDLERKLDEMTKRNKENESKLEENVRENSRLQSIVNEKDEQIDKLTVALNRSLAAQYQNIVNQVQNSSTVEEKIPPSSDALPISSESTPEPLPKAVSKSPEKLNHQISQVSFMPPQKILTISLTQLQENSNIPSASPQKMSTAVPQKVPEILATPRQILSTPSANILPTPPQEIRKLVSALPIKIPISVLRQIPKTPVATPEKQSPQISSAPTQQIIKTSPALISIKPMAELLETSNEDDNDASCSGSYSNGQYSEENPMSDPKSPTDPEISEEQDEEENFLGQNGARELPPDSERAAKIRIPMETVNQGESSSMSNLAAIQVSMETVRHEKPKSKPAPAEISKKKVQIKSNSTPVIKSIEISKNLYQQNPTPAPTTSSKSTKISIKKAPVVSSPQISKENAKGQKKFIPQKKSGISISLQVKRKRPVLKSSALAVFDEENEEKSSEPENNNDEDEEEKPSKKKRRKMTEPLAVASCSKQSINLIQLEPIFILNVPKVHRINYTFINNSELDNCPRASKFWYDPNPQCYSNGTKLLIRFYDDTKPWQESHLHVKEQKKLQEPKIKHMKFHEITKHLESLSKTKNAQCRHTFFFTLLIFHFFFLI